MGRLVHTGLGLSSLVAHDLHYPPLTHANSFVIGTAVINTRTSGHSDRDRDTTVTGTKALWRSLPLQCRLCRIHSRILSSSSSPSSSQSSLYTVRGIGGAKSRGTEVKYPFLRACSSSAAQLLPDYTLMYTHIGRLAILHISTRTVYLYMKREEECCYFRNPGLKRTFG